MAKAKLTAKGQTTVPLPIRRHLGIEPGDHMEFLIDSDGAVRVVAANHDVARLFGILGPAKRRVSVEEMNAAIRKRAARI